MSYPEISELLELIRKYNIRIQSNLHYKDSLLLVELNINNNEFELYIEDEFNDFTLENQPLCLFLILNSLEEYQESDDFLQWCNQLGLNASSTSWLEYYKSLDKITKKIETIIGPIDAKINPLDYQLRAGAFQELVKK
ncbi:hypothetical protein [Fulvivirga lutea]|uniref:Uncharacterized protein n=1 Tax=Fulvivirga lutea TaxID=2810512 RepID=A0A975A1Q0_9BACT|nr:hypothetical protein [Fulvivirga lutea]QSE98066.1 hypothetical protein JR347_03005 [Fulvivirga lutea]